MAIVDGIEMNCMNNNFNKCFIDTNILIYAHDKTNKYKYEKAFNLINTLWENRKACASIQVLQEFYVVVTKKIKNTANIEDIKKIISALESWDIHSPSVRDVLESIEIQDRYNISFWDSMIICSAKRKKCDVIFSEDLNNGQLYEGIIIKNPFIPNNEK